MADSRIPERREVSVADRWDLASLFASEAEWESSFVAYGAGKEKIEPVRADFGRTAWGFLAALELRKEQGLLGERLGVYASLRQSEDEGDADARGRLARYMSVATEVEAAWSWLVPAIQSLPDPFVTSCLEDFRFAEYAVFLRKILRFKPHVLSEAEERLLALQSEANQTADEAFSVLTNVDLDFGSVETPEGFRPLTQSTYASLLRNPDRAVRQRAYEAFYKRFESHRNTLATLYAGSVKLDVYRARVRNFGSSRAAALFPDDVPETVYDNLVATVEANLDALHGYYELRKKALGLRELHHWDV